MLENLIDLIKQHAGNAIINNPAIPNSQNDAAVAATGNSIISSLQSMITSGGGQEVLNLLQGKGGDVATNPATQNITTNVIQSLMSKFGLDQNAANGIATSVIPNVIQSLVHKTNDPNDSSFDLQGIIGHLTGGQGLQGIISNLEESGGAGIMDKIKGMFGNH